MALVALAQVCAVYALLVALAVLLLAVGLLAVAAAEVTLLLVANRQHPVSRRLGRH